MKEVGDKFGAGELILPFVLQSAEVMKRAVAQLEKYLDKLEGYTKGTVVLATVFGDVHDIGKSLVNTILTNNGYTVVDLGKQVPIQTILEAAKEHDATAIGLSALLVSTSKQMPMCIQELHEQELEFPVLIGGAAINRDFGLRALYPHGREDDTLYEPGVFYCKDAFEGLAKMDQIVDGEEREALVAKTREAAKRLREKGPEPEQGDTTDSVGALGRARPTPRSPTPPFWGLREIDVDMDAVYHHLDTHVLFKLHWGGRGVKGEAWEKLVSEDFRPRLERMWREADYLHPRARARLLPLLQRGQRGRRPRPRGPRDGARAARLPAPAQARPHLPRGLLPPEGQRRARRRRAAGGHRRRRGHRADGEARGRRRVRRAALHPRPRRADRRGHGRVAALAGARGPRHRARPGPALLVGLPRLPGAVRAREGLPPARRARDRPAAERRLRGRARAVDGRDRRAPPAGGLLRHEVGLPAEDRPPGARRAHRRHRQGPGEPARRACPTPSPAEVAV